MTNCLPANSWLISPADEIKLSVKVVLPWSMCATIPMFLMFSLFFINWEASLAMSSFRPKKSRSKVKIEFESKKCFKSGSIQQIQGQKLYKFRFRSLFMTPKKREKARKPLRQRLKRVVRRVNVWAGKRARERKAWMDLKGTKTFKEWKEKKLPERAAISFMVENEMKRLTPAEVAKEAMVTLKKEIKKERKHKRKSSIPMLEAKIYDLERIFKNTRTINGFESWVKNTLAYQKKMDVLVKEAGGRNVVKEFNRKELMSLVLPRELVKFWGSSKSAGAGTFENIVKGYIKELNQMARGGQFDLQIQAKKDLLNELLGNPKELEKLKKNVYDQLR
jgi:hypothetical protein